MTKSEFIGKMIGVRWVDRASSFGAVDCWGLIMLYYKHVLAIDLPVISGFESGACVAECHEDQLKHWELVEKPEEDGLVFTCYRGDEPIHVGLCIGSGKVLHARGSKENPGKVEIHSIKTIERVYGKITLHKFKGLGDA